MSRWQSVRFRPAPDDELTTDQPPDEVLDDKASDGAPSESGGAELIVAGDDDERLTKLISRFEGDGDRPVERRELVQILRSVQISERHSGPLPDPQTLKGYTEIIPNGAERIMRMAEKEQRHRHSLEVREQGLIETTEGHDFQIARRGQNYGLFTVLGVLVVALILAAMGQARLAGILVGLDLVALATVFVVGRYVPGRAQKGQDRDGANEGPADE